MGLLSQNSAPTRQDILRGLLQDEKSVAYRGGLLPYLARTVTDPIDDVSEYEQRFLVLLVEVVGLHLKCQQVN